MGKRRFATAAACLICAMQLIRPASAQHGPPRRALIGYWHNWQSALAPYIPIDQADRRYNMLHVAFATPRSGTAADMEFTPRGDRADFLARLRSLQAEGVPVLISAGGGNSPVFLSAARDRDAFAASMLVILEQYGFDGVDIDLEGASLSIGGGDIAAPADSCVIHLIDALRHVMREFRARTGRRMLLTMSPETAHVQGGMSAYGGAWGAYLPVIDALRDSIDVLHVQLYNSGTMFGIDRGIYTQGTADFIVALTEAVIQGFNTAGGRFDGLPETKIAVGLPACPSAAGGGYADPATAEAAIRYLLGAGPRPGRYFLAKPSGYPALRGMMTWSVNWDASSACGPPYEYAAVFQRLFGAASHTDDLRPAVAGLTAYPNPASDMARISGGGKIRFPCEIRVCNMLGEKVTEDVMRSDGHALFIGTLTPGIYRITAGSSTCLIVKL